MTALVVVFYEQTRITATERLKMIINTSEFITSKIKQILNRDRTVTYCMR
jgi:hypothetical protein